MSSIKPVTCTVVDFDGVGLQDMYVALDCSRRGDGTSTKFESFTNSEGIIQRWFRCAEPFTLFEVVDASDYERITLTFSTAIYFGRLRSPWVTVQVNVNPTEFEMNYVKLQFGVGNGTYSVKTISLPLQNMKWLEMESANQVRVEQERDCVREMHIENENGEPSKSIGSDSWQALQNVVPDSASLETPQTGAPSAPLLDRPLSTPFWSTSTLNTLSEPVSPLTLPSPRIPVLQSPRVPRTRSKRFSPLAVPSSPYFGQGRVTRSRKRKVMFEDELEPPRKRRRLE
ncbi:hypothetical protein HD806DRAFT_536089 [Xylariaceae sp. AK1471]|nr:hypothetical protein HD806DRAFT_536089 [Xylariaceae sp. AK1471]